MYSWWVTTVRQTLFHLGYGFVWLNQGVATEQHFIAQLKQRFIGVYSQEWLANLRGSKRFDMYILFKTSVKYETYRCLDFVRVKCFRDALIRFRLGITELKTHKNRYISHVADNVVHFVKPLKKTSIIFYFIVKSMKLLDRKNFNILNGMRKTGNFQRLCGVKSQHRPNSWHGLFSKLLKLEQNC